MANRKKTRYDGRAFNTDVLHATVKGFEGLGLITSDGAVFKQKRTLLHPTEAFRDLLGEHGVGFGDIGRLVGQETVELWTDRHGPQAKELLDYKDAPETEKLRHEMARINATLAGADICLDGKPIPAPCLVRKFHQAYAAAEPQFNLHGRLYGGAWQNLPKTKRYLLSIDGEQVCDLDFSSMFVRLAYCHVGEEPPAGDLYAIPGLENFRDVVKRALNSLLFREGHAVRFSPELKALLPPGWTMPRFKVAAAEYHPQIADLFDTNIGFELMAKESGILVGVLLKLSELGVPALPMHDGVMVPAGRKHVALRIMEEVSAELAGWRLPVAEKAIEEPSTKYDENARVTNGGFRS
ncbi:Hypothetical protein NGAL_HAMBI1145_59750 [Neorhizobium galegae bv. officinalis]|uniref:DNA-directed DNA polymerase family A palm domain-containing protein n=1 Tax=Neorhizobium galegae bv. officinalis TaxID=323656 RepID=A0A0T7G2R4_NEOGA|nr:Hypothetical protein NGAL_HAMBI1145_59750 [Neorhizobium galegae bv. officinalis]